MTTSTSHGETDRFEGRLLYRGAEADIVLGRWQGMDAVFKVRKPLPYRLPILDESIRHQRTIREAEMIHQAKIAGVTTPYLYDVDVAHATLVMEYVRGERLRDVVESTSMEDSEGIFRDFGRDVAKLHMAGLMHGDLTTANVVRSDGHTVFIDFGLAMRTSRLEDHAVDMRLIKETLAGAHPQIAQSSLNAILEGYSSVVGPARSGAVQRQLRNIERRGRYARVT